MASFKAETDIKVVIGLSSGDVFLWRLNISDDLNVNEDESTDTKLLYSHRDEVTNLAFNKDSTKIVSCALDNCLYVSDVDTGMILFKKEHPNCLICLSWCHENEILYLGDNAGIIHVWNLMTGEKSCSEKAFNGPITCITSKFDTETNKCKVIAAGIDGPEFVVKAWTNE